jgi:hypothetical protein
MSKFNGKLDQANHAWSRRAIVATGKPAGYASALACGAAGAELLASGGSAMPWISIAATIVAAALKALSIAFRD